MQEGHFGQSTTQLWVGLEKCSSAVEDMPRDMPGPEEEVAGGIEWIPPLRGFFTPVHFNVSFLMHSASLTKRADGFIEHLQLLAQHFPSYTI